MKKVLISLSFALCLSLALFIGACDKVTNPRIPGSTSNILVGSNFVVNTVTVSGSQRNVLVEDYTGHTCGNCPKAAKIADSLLKSPMASQLVVIAVHAGSYALPYSSADPTQNYPANYQTSGGTAWNTTYGLATAGNPNGMVNRKMYAGTSSTVVAQSAWFGLVNKSIATDPKIVSLKVTSFYDSTIHTENLDIAATFITDGYQNNLMVYACVIEDSIVGPQKEYNHIPEHIDNYRFDHMLRGSFNISGWGNLLKKAPINQGDTAHARFVDLNLSKLNLTPAFNDHNMWAVVYVYDAITLEVVQVCKVRIQSQ